MTLRPSLWLLAVWSSAAIAQDRYVDAAAPPGGAGTTWTAAHSTLQPALAAALPGTTIWVATGIYTGGFTIPAGVTVLGGMPRGATHPDQARPTVHPTILDGINATRVVQLGDGATIDGCVIRNGYATAPGGGGALVDGTSPTIRRCEFTANRNNGGRGAALAVIRGGDPLVIDCVFHHNASTGHTIDIDQAGRGTFANITVADNPHNGLHMQDGAVCTIVDSIFARNLGRGVCDVAQGAVNQPTLRNCLFWQNRVALVHVRGRELLTIAEVNALSYAADNVAADPRFVGATDYRLAADSGAIDRGGPTAAPRLDRLGVPRPLDGDLDGALAGDIGAHEFAPIELSMLGVPAAGSQVTFAVNGNPTLLAGLAVLLPAPPTVIAPFGAIWGTQPEAVLLGLPPQSLTLAIPAGLAADIVVQPFGLAATAGSVGNALALPIR